MADLTVPEHLAATAVEVNALLTGHAESQGAVTENAERNDPAKNGAQPNEEDHLGYFAGLRTERLARALEAAKKAAKELEKR